MFLGAYRFAGEPAELLAAHERLVSAMGSSALDLHICAAGPDGLVVVDACPDEATFKAFSSGPELRAACRRAGLPEPVVEPLGTVHHAVLRQAVER
jgi:hypothetical protein